MTAQDWVLILAAITGVIGAVFSGTATIMGAWATIVSKRNAALVSTIAEKVDTIQLQTNSLTQSLVEKTGEAAFAAGTLEEKERAAANLSQGCRAALPPPVVFQRRQ